MRCGYSSENRLQAWAEEENRWRQGLWAQGLVRREEEAWGLLWSLGWGEGSRRGKPGGQEGFALERKSHWGHRTRSPNERRKETGRSPAGSWEGEEQRWEVPGVGDVLFERLPILTSKNSTRCLLGMILLYFMMIRHSILTIFSCSVVLSTFMLLCTHHHWRTLFICKTETLSPFQHELPAPGNYRLGIRLPHMSAIGQYLCVFFVTDLLHLA